MNERTNELKKRVAGLKEVQQKVTDLHAKARLAADEYKAHEASFSAWLKGELGIPEEQNNILVPELILLWEKIDQPS